MQQEEADAVQRRAAEGLMMDRGQVITAALAAALILGVGAKIYDSRKNAEALQALGPQTAASDSSASEITAPTVPDPSRADATAGERIIMSEVLGSTGSRFYFKPLGTPFTCERGMSGPQHIAVCSVGVNQLGYKYGGDDAMKVWVYRAIIRVPFKYAMSAQMPDAIPSEGTTGTWVVAFDPRVRSDVSTGGSYTFTNEDFNKLGLRTQFARDDMVFLYKPDGKKVYGTSDFERYVTENPEPSRALNSVVRGSVGLTD